MASDILKASAVNEPLRKKRKKHSGEWIESSIQEKKRRRIHHGRWLFHFQVNAHSDEHLGLIYVHGSSHIGLDTSRRKVGFCASERKTCNADQGLCSFPWLKQEEMKLSETVFALCFGLSGSRQNGPTSNGVDPRRRCFMLPSNYSARTTCTKEHQCSLIVCHAAAQCLSSGIFVCRQIGRNDEECSLRFSMSDKQNSNENIFIGIILQ